MLTFLRDDQNKSRNGIFKCVCGTEKSIRKSAVKSNSTKSCGCHRRKTAIENGKKASTHGKTKTKLYKFWAYTKHSKPVCVDWQSFSKFEEWAKDNWYDGCGLVLKDGELEYGPSTCTVEPRHVSKLKNAHKTNLDKYGVTSHMKLDSSKEKLKQTCIDKYGMHPNLSPEVKEKTKATSLRKYGVKHYSQSQLSKSRSKARFQRYGGKTGSEVAQAMGVSASHMNKLIREVGYEQAIQYERKYSDIEMIISDILTRNEISFQQNQTIDGFKPDFILDQHNVIIEADGLYWHSDAINKDNYYHKNKKHAYTKNGHKSLFFREDEITTKKQIVESIIVNAVGKSQRVYARKCVIKEVSLIDRKDFLNDNHLMGVGRGRAFGLYVKDELLCIMQYTNRKGTIDISRFCNKRELSVIGGFSRLLKHIEKTEVCDTIKNFTDMRYGTGEHLGELGFVLETCYVSFMWTKNATSEHRMKFPGNSGYDYGYNKIYDCGQSKFTKRV